MKRLLRPVIERLVENNGQGPPGFAACLLEDKEELRRAVSTLDAEEERFDFGGETKDSGGVRDLSARALSKSNVSDSAPRPEGEELNDRYET